MIEGFLCTVLESVIHASLTENHFDQFIWAVDGGRGWNWIFQQPVLQTSVRLPPPAIGRLDFSDQLIEPLVHHVRYVKNWPLTNHNYNGQSLVFPDPVLSRRHLYLSFFRHLLTTMAAQMEGVRFLRDPIDGVWTTGHEGGVTCAQVGDDTGLWELAGDTSNGWGNRNQAFLALVPIVARDPDRPIHHKLAEITRIQAERMFADVIAGSGSCLVGVMVADLKNQFYQTRRFVSTAANMCGRTGQYSPHTSRGQGSQVHMEIFLLERLGAYLAATDETFAYADVGILGIKTSTVVNENAMCDACDGTKQRELDRRVPGKLGSVSFGISFVG